MIEEIPFEKIGINKNIGKSTVAGVRKFIYEYPNKPIDVQSIAEKVGFPGEQVKKVFYALLNLHYLKATFFPRHKQCGNAIGKQEFSVSIIREKIEHGDYSEGCVQCMEPINSLADIEIQIIFWNNANVRI